MLRFHLRQGGPAATPPAPDPEAARAADAGGACRGICGAEWWVQVRRAVGGGGGAAAHRASLASGGALAPEASIAFHWDGDEARMRASQHVPPLLATVTYLGGAGAPTLVLPLAADARGAALPAPRPARAAEPAGAAAAASDCAEGGCAYLSRPVPGKHLAFDGRLLHGCPAEYAAPPAATAAAPPAAAACQEAAAAVEGREAGAGRTWRVSLLVNVWQCHRPSAARPLPAEMAARLSDAPGCACTLGSSARPVAPAACDTAAAAAEDVTLHIGSGGTHAPVVVRDLPPAAHVASLAADFVRMPRVSVALT